MESNDSQSVNKEDSTKKDVVELLLKELEKQKMLALAGAHLISLHADTYIFRQPCRTSDQTGWKWIVEILDGHPTRCHEMFRMQKDVFMQFCQLLHDEYGLRPTSATRVEEMVAIFLMMVGLGHGNRETQERFQHSGSAVHKFFYKVLRATTQMSMDWIKPRNISTVHEYIRRNQRYWPHFKVSLKICYFISLKFDLLFIYKCYSIKDI